MIARRSLLLGAGASLLAGPALAQIRGAGLVPQGAKAFNPRRIPGLALWLRGDRKITFNGSAVSAWGDLAQLGNDATQATEASQPAYDPSAIGGRPGLVTDGGDFLTIADFPYDPSSFGVFMAVHITEHASTGQLFQHYLTSGDQRAWRVNVTTDDRIQIQASPDGTSAGLFSEFSSVLSLPGDFIIEFYWDEGGVTVLANGATILSETAAFSSVHNSTADLVLFSGSAADTAGAEVGLISGVPAAAQKAALRNHLSTRYSTPLA